MTDKPVREMTRDESARHAERLVRQALDDPDHVGPLLHEALIMLRPFASESDETQPRAVLMIDGEIDWKTAQAIRGVTASEVKVLTETATRLGREMGRREAWTGVAEALEAAAAKCMPWSEGRSVLTETARNFHNLASPASGATSDATSGVPRHPEVSEAVRSPKEPCDDPECPVPLMHSHPDGNTP